MTLTAIKSSKNTRFLLSEQVKELLLQKGFLKVFNYQDYQYYKEQVKHSFNKALAIAELFISDNDTTNTSDFNDYIF
ncbi:MAG: hypothetical protein ACSHXA_07575 [Polaribacter sp.]|uniref:hypothetical protein n=1 Tax=Polaribacter sp. TaxID=1920175 RepID=UPI003EF19F93